jgi:hypothetical protein
MNLYARSHIPACKIVIVQSLASAIQLFLGNGLASFIQIGLAWFPTKEGTPTEAYVNSKINYFLYIFLGVAIFGILINILPAVKNWVEQLKDDALDATALDLTMNNSDDFSSTSLGVDNNNNNNKKKINALEMKGEDGGLPESAQATEYNHIEEIAF